MSNPIYITKERVPMNYFNTTSLESNRQIKINFDGGDLSSDAGLLLIKEFVSKLGIDKLFSKNALASQPTISRFHNRMDENTLNQFFSIARALRKKIYSIQMPEAIILDLDSTLLEAYGKQEGRAFNFHYQSNGYHPLVCYDGITGDLIKIQLRDGTKYSCSGVVEFLQPILDEYLEDYPSIKLLLRGDSGFATPDLYKQCEENGTSYVIRLKENNNLREKALYLIDELDEITKENKVDNAVVYGEFMYQAGSWPYERRVVCKIEKPENQLTYLYTFIVTNMDASPEYLIKFYCKRGLMENFIKESKSGFDFASVSSHSRLVNANRLHIHELAYNIFNWFRRLALSANMRKQRIDTVRLKLLKIAAKVIRSARYTTFKLCSSCPYKNEFYETLSNISNLNVQLE